MSPRALFASVLAAILVVAGPTVAGDSIVIESTDPAMAPGFVVKADATLTLAAGTVVTLLAESGAIVKLEGPYEGPPPGAQASSNDQLVSGLANLFGDGSIDASAFGAVRAAAAPSGPPDLWTVDLSISGHRCIDAAGPRGMWRGAAATGRLRALAGGGEVEVAWNDPTQTPPWPTTVPIDDGADYAFLPDGGGSPAHVVMHRLNSVLPTAGHLLRWLGEQGCTTQARLLLARMVAAPEPLSLGLSTDRGPAPVLRIGEVLALRLATNRDAFVHCLYQQADGTVVGLFPNRFTGGPRLAGHVSQGVPSGGDNLNLTLSGPAGEERVHCFAWTEDPATRLPEAVADADITQPIAEPLDAVLAAMAAAAPEATASLTIELRE